MDKPKALVEVSGKTILARAIEALSAHGVERLVLATGYREEALLDALAGVTVELSFCRNPDYETTQNSVSLALCRDALAGGAFFKLDGDVLFDSRILERLDSAPEMLAVAVDRRAILDPEAMKVRVGSDGRIAA